MLTFFANLYLSLFVGYWSQFQVNQWADSGKGYLNALMSFIVNALGGNFESLQSFNFFDPQYYPASALTGLNHIHALIAYILGVVTTIGVCVAVWKITKALFAVFFRGAR